jgi:FkbM family methyltransferase
MSQTFGDFAASLLNPPVRFLSRYLPPLRPALWNGLIGPKLSWRDHRFVARTEFGALVEGTTLDVIQRYIYYFGIWEPYVSRFVARRISPGDVVLDIGANIGYMSLLAASAVGPRGRVVAIEASAATYRKLKANLNRNDARQVQAIHGAVADQLGTLTLFHAPDTNTGMTSLVRDFGEGGEAVQAGPLQHWVAPDDLRRARLIKIDVEGAEAQVLESLLPLAGELSAKVEIVCEISPELVPAEQLSRLIERFMSAGFRLYSLPDDTMENYLSPPAEAWAVRLEGPLTRRTELIFSRLDQHRL